MKPIKSDRNRLDMHCPPTVLIKLIVGWAVDETNKIGSESVGYALPTNSFNKINRRVGSG
uniref:Uncharacterized protein n=1 Tax=Moorena producens (strain JHB) TaxID=1454205 RepID=A0A1D9FVJ8_MOOP1